MIKVPLVRDTLLLVLNLLHSDNSTTNLRFTLYCEPEFKASQEFRRIRESARTKTPNGQTVDDINTLETKRKPHLSEVSLEEVNV